MLRIKMHRIFSVKMQESLRGIFRPYRWHVVLLSGLTVVQSVLQVALAVITRYVIDAAISGSGKLPFWGAVLVGDSLALILLHTSLSWIAGSVTDRFGAKLRRSMLSTAVYSRDEKLQRYHSGALLSRAMEDVHAVCEGMIHIVPNLVGQITRLAATFVAVLLIYPPVAAVLFAVAGAITLGAALLLPVLKARQREVRRWDEKIMSTMQEDFQQLELVQSLDAQE